MTAVAARPGPSLSVLDALAVVVGVVVGAGIFKTPALVAATTGSAGAMLAMWVVGGLISLLGALCYAELASAYPSAGGEYHFLGRALGPGVSFLFAWARLAVIQTGSIAMQAFIVGDYLAALSSAGPRASAVYAALAVAAATVLHALGLRQGRWTQHLLSSTTVLGLVLVGISGLVSPERAGDTPGAVAGGGTYGLALVFVLLTYGGWSEAAYLSAEMRKGGRGLVYALVGGLGIIATIYVLANLAYLRGLGVEGMASTEVVAADLMRLVLGETGALVISVLIVVAALSTVSATVFTGARTAYALGCDYEPLRFLAHWRAPAQTPTRALFVQGGIALGLVALGAFTRAGFVTMVEYTAPVFWLFIVLVGASLLILRRRDLTRPRPFRVPFYPLSPILFCAAGSYMLLASVRHAGLGALAGLAVLAAGVPFALAIRKRARRGANQEVP